MTQYKLGHEAIMWLDIHLLIQPLQSIGSLNEANASSLKYMVECIKCENVFTANHCENVFTANLTSALNHLEAK